MLMLNIEIIEQRSKGLDCLKFADTPQKTWKKSEIPELEIRK